MNNSVKKQPPFLREGDEVAIISPSWSIDEDKISYAVNLLESWGLKVRLGRNVLKRYGPFAGTDRERLDDLQEMTNDKKIKAVFCSRGGYGLLRIIDSTDFSALKESPKWYIGFSDITVLHIWLNEICKIISIHGDMPLNYSDEDKSEETFVSLHRALFGEYRDIFWEGRSLRSRDAEGEVTGGNLSLIYSLIGTKAEPSTRGKILFIEDVGEYLYHFDRMIASLKLAGKLSRLSALVIGGLNRMEETKIPWGKTAEEIISEAVSGYSYPVFFDFPAGHVTDNRAFYIGKRAKITYNGISASLTFI